MKSPRLCSFTKADGSPCRAPAIRNSPRCRHHHRLAARYHRRRLALSPGRTVRLGPLATRPAIQYALNRLMQLVAAGTLPPHRARHALSRINLALNALHRREATIANAVIPSGAAQPRSRGTLASAFHRPWSGGPHRQMTDIDIDGLLNSFTAAFNPLTLELEFAPANLPGAPPRLRLGGNDLPSPSAAPTINQTPAIRRPSQPAVHNPTHPLSSQRPPAYPAPELITDNVQRTTDNATS